MFIMSFQLFSFVAPPLQINSCYHNQAEHIAHNARPTVAVAATDSGRDGTWPHWTRDMTRLESDDAVLSFQGYCHGNLGLLVVCCQAAHS